MVVISWSPHGTAGPHDADHHGIAGYSEGDDGDQKEDEDCVDSRELRQVLIGATVDPLDIQLPTQCWAHHA